MRDVGRESAPYVRFFSQHALVALAVRQHLVLSLEQLNALGLGTRAAQRRASVGHLHRIHHRVYSLTPKELLTVNGHFMAAVLACGPGAVLSHRSAAHLHELRRTERVNIDVTVPKRSHRRHGGIDVHRSTTLTAVDLTTVSNIPCTTIARTMLDLAAVVPQRGVERAFEQGEILEVLDLYALLDEIERHPKLPAALKLRTILEGLRPDAKPTESPLEEAFLALCRVAGFPEPERQVWLTPVEGEPSVRVDFLWRAQRLIVETDGRKVHSTGWAFEADRRKDQRLTLADWTVIRVTWHQLREEREELISTIAALLTRA